MDEGLTDRSVEATIPVLTGRIGSWRISVQRLAFSPAQLGRRYDGKARRWDRVLARLGYPGAYEGLCRTLLAQRRLVPCERRHRVLDCGVGTGAASAGFLAALGGVPAAGLEIDALDVSPRMLECAQRSLCRPGLTVRVHRHDVCELPFAAGVFDFAIAAHVLEHLARPDVALAEIVRVLKPGGLALVCLTRRSLPGTFVHVKYRTHRVTASEARRWLLDSGLEQVRCLQSGAGMLCKRLSVACVGRKPG